MLDPRSMATTIIAALIIYYFWGIKAVFWIAFACALFAFLYFIYLILRVEGKVDWFKKWVRGLWKRYLKIERKFFNWIDSL